MENWKLENKSRDVLQLQSYSKYKLYNVVYACRLQGVRWHVHNSGVGIPRGDSLHRCG